MRTILSAVGIAISFFFVAITAHASTGFIGNPIWIYPEFPREGEKVTLSALFHNDETEKLAGTVLFYDNDTLLGRKLLSIPVGDVGTATIVFSIGPGNHIFSARAEGFQEISTSGNAKTLSIPLGKAELPTLFVTKNGSATGADALPLKASAQAAPILDKVDAVQNKVVDSIPDSVKEPVVNAAESVESWRQKTTDQLKTAVADGKRAQETQKKNAASGTKSSQPKTQFIDGPFSVIKLFVAEALLALFSHAVFFYLALIGIIYFIVRSILHAVKQRRKDNRMTKKFASKMQKQ